MNNNRNNNRRRGRGNRPQGGGGGPVNRIDSRARGNAPQMLEKYKKLAQDAQHNGDRVQMEYYLQFADHYYRVMADTRQRQDEQRPRRDDAREQRPQQAEDYEREDDGYGRDDAPDQRFAPRPGNEARGERPFDEGDDRRADRSDRVERPRFAERRPRRDSFEAEERGDMPSPDIAPDATAEKPEARAPRRPREGGRRELANGRAGPRGRANGGYAGEDVPGSDAPAIDASVLPPAFNPVEQVEGEPTLSIPPRRRRVKPVELDGDAPAIVNG